MTAPSHPSGDKTRVDWNHRYTWTDDHATPAELHHYLFSYDTLGSDALDRLDEVSPPPSKSFNCSHGSGPGQRDLYEILQQNWHKDEVLSRLWQEVTTVPDWVDWEQIERGQQVYYQFGSQIMLGLMYNSLIGGMGSSRVVETLGRTGGFGVRVARRRLLETLQHFVDVIEDIDAVKPGGKGFVSSVRVRLLHAAVRRRIMALEKEKPGYYDTDTFGVPINDLHCIATICAYSCAVIWLALPRQGVVVSEQQAADYLALWRWIGYIMGTPVGWMSSPSQAKAMVESVMVAELDPSDKSRLLTNNILTVQANAPPLFAKREYLAAISYKLNGWELSRALGIATPRLRYRALFWVQCMFFMCFGYAYPYFSDARKARMETNLRKMLNKLIQSHKNELLGDMHDASKFKFQYVPALGKETEMAAAHNPAILSHGGHKWVKSSIVLVAGALAIVWLFGHLHSTTMPDSWSNGIASSASHYVGNITWKTLAA